MEIYLPVGIEPPKSLIEAAKEFVKEVERGNIPYFSPIPTGFPFLDQILSGGIFAGHLLLVGGKPNVGKTIFALQMARNIARNGVEVVFVCYEHDLIHIFMRLLALETFLSGSPLSLEKVREIFQKSQGKFLFEKMTQLYPETREAIDSMIGYADFLYITQGDSLRTTPQVLLAYVQKKCTKRPAVLIVDYLQKIPLSPEESFSPEKVAVKLKEIALNNRIAVVAVSALEAEAIHKKELSLADLMGDSLVKYEPDAVLMLEAGENSTVQFRMVKNRTGPANLSFSLRLHGENFAFSPL